jgi:hypothetical protein
MRLAAQGHEGAVAEGDWNRQAIEALAHPGNIAVEEGAGLVQVALHGQRDNHSATRAAHAQCQAARTRMTPHFDGRSDIVVNALSLERRRR